MLFTSFTEKGGKEVQIEIIKMDAQWKIFRRAISPSQDKKPVVQHERFRHDGLKKRKPQKIRHTHYIVLYRSYQQFNLMISGLVDLGKAVRIVYILPEISLWMPLTSKRTMLSPVKVLLLLRWFIEKVLFY